jgi:hypothetical protein
VAEEGRVEESINKMLLQNRIDKFRNGSGARSEEEMSLYEEMMRVLNARIAKKN